MADYHSIPQELKESGCFFVWRYEERNGKRTKVPYNPLTGSRAQSNNKGTATTFLNALRVSGQYDGLGVGIFDGFSAIDIDHCVDDNNNLSEMAKDIISTMASYTELSPSGKGVRILFKASGFKYDKERYYINNQKAGLEVYISGATNKYVTVTGDEISQNRGIEECTDALQVVLDKYMRRTQKKGASPAQSFTLQSVSDTAVLEKIHKSRNAGKFGALWSGDIGSYQSQSEADLALCNILAFYTNKDAAQIDRLFRQSGLMRESKWDRPQSGSTYGKLTIQKAIADCGNAYNPSAYRAAASQDSGDISEQMTLAGLHPERNPRYSWNDMGNGYLFADWHKNKARYVPERKKWFVYNGKVWKSDIGDLKIMELCKKLADELMVYALSLPEGTAKQDYIQFVGKWQKRHYRETIIKDAASVYPVEISAFDADPFLFNCLNGTLNLHNGTFHAHHHADMLSKLSGVHYNPQAKSERWERFIDEVMQGDQSKAAFLQKALGYALTGDTRYECFFVLYGPTSRNGKGTTMETFLRLVGDYGKTCKPDTIAQKQTANGNGPSEDIARLAGARFVNISEPDKKLILSAALVKTLTGNDTITARFLNENSFEYKPQFKLFINTNHLPAVTDVTLFASGRVKIIPFERHFGEADRDDSLKTKLASPDNLSGVLNWCLEGLRLIEETGFDAPPAVQAATDEYRKNSDKIGRFLDEVMEPDAQAETRTSEAYNHYKAWCVTNGYFPENAANFKSSLANIATVVRRRPRGSSRTENPVSLLIGYRLETGFSETNRVVPFR